MATEVIWGIIGEFILMTMWIVSLTWRIDDLEKKIDELKRKL